MKPRSLARILCPFALTISLCLIVNAPPARASSLRITMNDGTSTEVPYYWEEDGEVKFEFSGGVAGIPKNQIKSVQEIITASEFDPQALAEASNKGGETEQQKALRDLVAKSAPVKPPAQELTPDEGAKQMRAASTLGKKNDSAKDQAQTPAFNLEGDFSEFVRVEGKDLVLFMRNVLSSRKDLRNQSFILTLYDGEGKVLEQKPCELRPIDVDKKTLRSIGIRGYLYTIVATLKPDPKIRRYDIATSRRY